MRPLVVAALLLGGCGPLAGPDSDSEEVDEDWMLGVYSGLSDIPGVVVGGLRYELRPEGEALLVFLNCAETELPTTWVKQDDGTIRIDYSQDKHPTSIVFSQPQCDPDGFLSYRGYESFRISPESPEAVSDIVLYRSSLCVGENIGDVCGEDDLGGECGSTVGCAVVWCDGAQPERCDE